MALTTASSWLATVSGTTITSGGTDTPLAIRDPTYQDLLYTQYIDTHLIPFGVEAGPGAALVGLLVFLRVRQKIKTKA